MMMMMMMMIIIIIVIIIIIIIIIIITYSFIRHSQHHPLTITIYDERSVSLQPSQAPCRGSGV